MSDIQPSEGSVLKNPVIRTGLLTGLGLSIVFVVWIYLANRVPQLERVALERNAIAAACLGLIALVPVVSFCRTPKLLLFCSLIAWSIFTLVYRALCIVFWALSDWRTTSQVFMEGAMVYLLVATCCWLATLFLRLRATQSHSATPQPRNHAS